ncbi:MAG TPA: hypothetical protein PK250_02585 [Syntrophobacter fumaroxidans]|nr:hypothetical protein [Syntrophobacter fumaroxidans]
MKRMKFIVIFSVLLLLVPAVILSQDGFDPNTYKSDGPMPYFNSHAFQSGIRSTGNIGELAKQYSPLQSRASTYGFAARSDEARFFLIGALYTEALAYVTGGKWELAAQRLEVVEGEFVKMGAPSSLYGFITKARNMIENVKYPPEYLVTVLALFQPFFEEYAKAQSEDKLTLFRAGAWLVNMSLTAASGDRELLRQPATLSYFTSELKRMDAPKGVVDALEEIAAISGKADITDKDTQKVLQLVTQIEQLLS